MVSFRDLRRHCVLPGSDSFSFVGCVVENLSCEPGLLRCRSAMCETAMRYGDTTSTKQSLRSWRTFRPEIARSLSSVLFALAVGTLQGCGDGSIDASPGESLTLIAANSAILSWSQPTTNQDGYLLTDLLGYRIYYGQTTPITATCPRRTSGSRSRASRAETR